MPAIAATVSAPRMIHGAGDEPVPPLDAVGLADGRGATGATVAEALVAGVEEAAGARVNVNDFDTGCPSRDTTRHSTVTVPAAASAPFSLCVTTLSCT